VRHPAGVEHELVVVFNGVGDEQRPALEAELGATEHRLLTLERPVMDLAAYALAARSLEASRVCFLNSYSVILADGWLANLVAALELPGVGVAGATGSWESRAEPVAGGLEHWLYQLVKLREKRRQYPRFPNPHIRSTGFMLERDVMLELGLERARDKSEAYLLESGRHGITGQLRARGLRAVVVGRDGRAYEAGDWPQSGTYRSLEQRNLLISDNRSREWQHGSRRLRGSLSRRIWGDRRA
jgi:hypothetical protein